MLCISVAFILFTLLVSYRRYQMVANSSRRIASTPIHQNKIMQGRIQKNERPKARSPGFLTGLLEAVACVSDKFESFYASIHGALSRRIRKQHFGRLVTPKRLLIGSSDRFEFVPSSSKPKLILDTYRDQAAEPNNGPVNWTDQSFLEMNIIPSKNERLQELEEKIRWLESQVSQTKAVQSDRRAAICASVDAPALIPIPPPRPQVKLDSLREHASHNESQVRHLRVTFTDIGDNTSIAGL